MDTSGLIEHPRPAPYPFGPTSIATILNEGVADHPDRVALIDDERTWSWAELDVAVSRVAGGIAPGEQLWWSLGNCAEAVIGMLATFRAGAVWIAAPWEDAAAHRPALTKRLGPIALIDSVKAYESLGARSLHRTETPAVGPATPSVVMFTSGTTGQPKAVVHSQHNLLGPGLLSIQLEPPEPGERIGTPLDLGNANIAVLGPISALLRGSTFVVLARRYAPALAADIATHAVTRLFAVPALAFDLVESGEVSVEQLRSLDRMILDGSSADPKSLRRSSERFDVRPTLSYGMSEAPTGVVRESLDDPIGSGRGFPLLHIELEILDSAGTPLDTGVDGEICLRPASTGPWANTWTGTFGYLGEPERTAELFRGGVLHTGDLGRLDADGALSITGRMSDLIIRGGKNIDPIEIEARLTEFAFVRETLVVGIPDERLGQRVGALIVIADSSRGAHAEDFDADSVDFAEMAMTFEEEGGFEYSEVVPVDTIAFVNELPRNVMGKVIRAVPREFLGPDNLD